MAKKNKSSKNIERELRKQAANLIVAAFALVAGLAWNDAVLSFIDAVFPAAANSILAKFVYAVLVTIAAVLASLYIKRILVKKEKEEEEKE